MQDLPKGVAEAADLAEELHARMYPPQEEPSYNEEDIQNEVIDTPEDGEEEVVEDTVEEKKFRDRYMSLKGKYDAEVPRLAAELRELREQMNRPKVAEAPESSLEPEEDFMSTVSEEYGEDFINAIRKVIQHEVKPIVQPVLDQTQQVQNVQNDVAQESFKAYLDTKVDKEWRSDWDALVAGEDTPLREFLTKPDPSGLYTYGDLVDMYNTNWDADRLAIVFNTYLETKTSNEEKPKRTNATNQQKDALIAPSRSNTQVTPNTEGKRIWTMAQFEDFQKNDRMGRYSPEESQRLWDDVASAPSEGRMR